MLQVRGRTARKFGMCQGKNRLNFYIGVDEDGKNAKEISDTDILPFLCHISYFKTLCLSALYDFRHFWTWGSTAFPVPHQITL